MPPRSRTFGSAPVTGKTETREMLNIGTRVQTGFLDAGSQPRISPGQLGKTLPHNSKQKVLGFIPVFPPAS